VAIKYSYPPTSLRLLFVTTNLYGDYILSPTNIMVTLTIPQ